MLSDRWNGLLFAILLLATGGCETISQMASSMDKPTADVVGASLRNLTLDGAGLDFDVKVSNPYPTALPLVNLDYQLSSGDATFLTGAADVAGTIPAGGSRTLKVPTNVTFAEALRTLSGVWPGSVVPYKADLALSVNAPGVGPISLPLSHAGELPIPAVPDVQVQRMALERMSLDEVSGVLKLQVRNTNQFVAGLSRMDYNLSLGGSPVASSTLRQSLSLEPGASGDLEIPLSFSPLQAGMAILDMLRGDRAGFDLGGTMGLDTPFGALDVPFQRSGVTPLER